MSVREKLEQRIEEKEVEIKSHEARANEARIYVQALQEALRLLPKDAPEGGVDITLRTGTNLDKARETLRAKGEPMHIADLLKALGKPDDNVNRAALSGSMSAYVRKGQVFTRPAPNTFGLIEFVAKPTPKGPPPDFGRDEQIDEQTEQDAAVTVGDNDDPF